jgi:hypothetical protein
LVGRGRKLDVGVAQPGHEDGATSRLRYAELLGPEYVHVYAIPTFDEQVSEGFPYGKHGRNLLQHDRLERSIGAEREKSPPHRFEDETCPVVREHAAMCADIWIFCHLVDSTDDLVQ